MASWGTTGRGRHRGAAAGRIVTGLLLPGLLAALGAATRDARAAIEVATATGVVATLHPAEEVSRLWIEREAERVWFRHPVAGAVELLAGPDDPRLPRRPVDGFLPLEAASVSAALHGIEIISPAVSVEIFLLPAPPVETLGSFARRDAIFLSPGFGVTADAVVAALVMHELGHVLTWGYIDPRAERWGDYLRSRGLDVMAGDGSVPHAERAREVLAEDIRFLFGGRLAREGRGLENDELPLPDAVPGLRAQLAAWLTGPPPAPESARALAFPNPSRGPVVVESVGPRRQVGGAIASGSVAQPAADGVVLDVFDLRGRLVRRIAGGQAENGRILTSWDGRDAAGQAVAAGCYVCSVRSPAGVARGTVLIVH